MQVNKDYQTKPLKGQEKHEDNLLEVLIEKRLKDKEVKKESLLPSKSYKRYSQMLVLIIQEGKLENKIAGFETKEQLEFYIKKVVKDNPKADSIELIKLPTYELIRKIK